MTSSGITHAWSFSGKRYFKKKSAFVPVCMKRKKHKMEQEFLSLANDSPQFRDFTVGLDITNRAKNRYNNVIAQEQSRVKLKVQNVEENSSDYINANYFHSALGHFILTQAPLPTTFSDFWKMIWQENSRVIVMLTKLREGLKGKADAYWPELDQTVVYGPGISVTTVSLQLDLHYALTTRVFRVEYEDIVRTVTQLQLDDWPDFGVPTSTASILHLSLVVGRLQPTPDLPITLHCSAGLGRTGTFAAIHLMRGQTGCVRDIVRQLRDARPGSVQTLQQYIFIYKALADWQTSIAKLPLRDRRRKMRAPQSPIISEREAKRVRILT